MASKIVIRFMFIAALVVTAHTIKPFSLGSVSTQALGIAQSFSFVLPEAAAERIKHAHYLAHLYGKGLFDDETSPEWVKQNLQNLLPANLVAVSNAVELNDDAEIKDVRAGDLNRKSAPKRPVKRVKRDDTRDEDSGCSKNSEITHLPEVRSLKAVALVQPIGVTSYRWVMISKPIIMTLECPDTIRIRVESFEAPLDAVTGPDEEEAEVTEQTETTMEPEPMALPEPTAPRIPECIRIP
ncbi:MAG: hypothetical protein ACKVZH_00615 [Blastocatellia bacterium]